MEVLWSFICVIAACVGFGFIAEGIKYGLFTYPGALFVLAGLIVAIISIGCGIKFTAIITGAARSFFKQD
jgi:hypothetical protein